MSLSISSMFDGGNIVVRDATRPEDLRLAIRPDEGSRHFMWFCFRIVGERGPRTIVIENAGESSFTAGWRDYRACASYDLNHWFRVPTTYRDGELIIQHEPERDACTYAYFAPYSLDRHRDFVARVGDRAAVSVVGRSVDGRDIDLIRVGEPDPGRLPCWIIARQHPGETMAEWFMEGLVDRLLDGDDPVVRELRARATFYLVPNMNPDGSFRGHLRVNAAGANLNREWADPHPERCPEVHAVRAAMKETGVRFFLDVHGDEGLPYNFTVGPSPSIEIPEAVRASQRGYEAALVKASPDFQTEHGYPTSRTTKPDLRKATNWVAHEFGALAMTLEQPFKDTKDSPDDEHGWSPPRCRHLGRANLDALYAVIDDLAG
jgi:murein tripeptide amidase MpaA